MGNAVVAVPSRQGPVLATDFYQVLETSDVPAGVVNIVTGLDEELRPVLASHDDVDGMWYFGSAEGAADVERLSTGNMKRTWVDHGLERDWFSAEQGQGEDFLWEATQIKNIWIPYGE
jgi:aldehyde dehydrogenase (NAD+)